MLTIVSILAMLMSAPAADRSDARCPGASPDRWAVFSSATRPVPMTVSGCATGASVRCVSPVLGTAPSTLADGDALLMSAAPGTPWGVYLCALDTDQGASPFAVVVVP